MSFKIDMKKGYAFEDLIEYKKQSPDLECLDFDKRNELYDYCIKLQSEVIFDYDKLQKIFNYRYASEDDLKPLFGLMRSYELAAERVYQFALAHYVKPVEDDKKEDDGKEEDEEVNINESFTEFNRLFKKYSKVVGDEI